MYQLFIVCQTQHKYNLKKKILLQVFVHTSV